MVSCLHTMTNEHWLIDSGCSFHMTPHKEWFSTYEKYDGGEIYLDDNSSYPIIRRGKIQLCFSDGRIKTLPGVLHVPRVARNLISVSKLNELGINVTFDKHGCKLVRGNPVIERGTRKGTLFRLEATTIVNSTNVTKKFKNTCMLWHHRLGHISETSLKTILNKKLLDSFSYSNEF